MTCKRSSVLAFAALIALCGGLLPTASSHAMSLVGPPTAAAGIDGLLVDGITYDVSFVHDSYANVYASTPPTFLGNNLGANDASAALVTALNGFQVTSLVGLSSPGWTNWNLIVPSYPPPAVFGSVACATYPTNTSCTPVGDWGYSSFLVGDPSTVFDNADFAVFTAETPLPAALPLFAGGLGAFGLFGWRRKRKAVA